MRPGEKPPSASSEIERRSLLRGLLTMGVVAGSGSLLRADGIEPSTGSTCGGLARVDPPQYWADQTCTTIPGPHSQTEYDADCGLPSPYAGWGTHGDADCQPGMTGVWSGKDADCGKMSGGSEMSDADCGTTQPVPGANFKNVDNDCTSAGESDADCGQATGWAPGSVHNDGDMGDHQA